ncbi:Eukaryotic/viral aspartic protease [Phytophthora megakarya]|uniref:Eukaryotic/viral aspartic protease n=1 Tax=Phytophthora megakarya TaxID=4795 RepID=A0A225WC67_9STRA|nr:Eukaryotic/viral aspartic protease [Phytophthora megakarya]
MTGDEVCALFGDQVAGSACKWYLQLKKLRRTSWTEVTVLFHVRYCGKGVFTSSRYYHASKHVYETPLKYWDESVESLLRWDPKEKREHAKLFINTFGAQE